VHREVVFAHVKPTDHACELNQHAYMCLHQCLTRKGFATLETQAGVVKHVNVVRQGTELTQVKDMLLDSWGDLKQLERVGVVADHQGQILRDVIVYLD